VPWDEDALGLEGVLCPHEGLGEDLAVVRDDCVHIVDQEWLREMVLVVRVWHRLEVERHRGSTLHIAKFVHASGGVAVGVKELSGLCSVLGEVRVRSTGVPFLVVIDHMVGRRSEQGGQLLVGEDSV